MIRKLLSNRTYGMSVGILLMLAGAIAQKAWVVSEIILACALVISIIKAWFAIKSR
jgi:hypothetical protein